MNAIKRSAARVGLVLCSVLAVAVTGCQTPVVHERTVYLPAPPPPVVDVPPAPTPEPSSPTAYVTPAPAPQPAPVVIAPPPPEPPPVVVIQSENDFYEPLAAYGRWEVVGSYGRCWVPARVDAGWRPYANGYWQRTDAGWYWASDEPWGWATYHYGRWDFVTRFGWVWVPQTQWAPAWVAWREGGGYVGWAPLRPSVTIGVNIHAGDYEPAFASRAFVFVEHRRMLEPVRPQNVVVNNTTIINKTVNITKVKVVNKTVINEGPRLEVVERESGRKVQSVPAREFRHREETTVAAREQNIPTANPRKVQPPARTEPQRTEKKTVLPPVARQVENPAVAVTRPARPLVTPALPLPSQAQAGKPARNEKKHEAEITKKFATPPPTLAPKMRSETRLETRHETELPVKVEAAPSVAFKKQVVPPSEKLSAKRPVVPAEKSRAAGQAEANKKKKEDKSPKKEMKQG